MPKIVGYGTSDNEVGWHTKMGKAGFIVRAPEEPCFVNCKYDWIRAGTVAVIAGLSVSGSVKKGGWWKGGLASLGAFFGTNLVLTMVPRGGPDIPPG
jgi:hypothetical protein